MNLPKFSITLKKGNISNILSLVGKQTLFFAVGMVMLGALLVGCVKGNDNGNDACIITNASADCDGDGVGNGVDKFPNDACASVDTDGDGQPDSLIQPDAADDDACAVASALTEDTDDDNDLLPDDIDDASLVVAELTVAVSGVTAGTFTHDIANTSGRRFRVIINNSVADAYKIGLMETSVGASNTATNITALAAATTIGGATVDHSTRLRRGGITLITNPLAADGDNVGVIYTFLPGDDAAATTTLVLLFRECLSQRARPVGRVVDLYHSGGHHTRHNLQSADREGNRDTAPAIQYPNPHPPRCVRDDNTHTHYLSGRHYGHRRVR